MRGLDIHSNEGVRFSSYLLQDNYLVRLAWLMPLCTVICAVFIHLLMGNYRDIPFFISEADYPGIERIVFTCGLFLSAGVQCLLALRLHVLFVHSARKRILFVATILGVVSSIHLAVLAFADMYNHLEIHVYTSIVVFHGGFAWAFLAHFSLENPNRRGRQLRMVSLAVALSSLIVMTVSLGRGIKQRTNELGLESDMIPLDQLQPWINVAAPAEFVLFFALMGCLASFTWDVSEQSNQLKNSSIES